MFEWASLMILAMEPIGDFIFSRDFGPLREFLSRP
jgi:hypothetical protein